MEDQIWKFVGWIYDNYGRTGLAVSLIIILSVIALAFFLLSRLPENDKKSIPKNIIEKE